MERKPTIKTEEDITCVNCIYSRSNEGEVRCVLDDAEVAETYYCEKGNWLVTEVTPMGNEWIAATNIVNVLDYINNDFRSRWDWEEYERVRKVVLDNTDPADPDGVDLDGGAV